MKQADHSLVIVTPVYEDSEASGRLFRELAAAFGRVVYLVAVDDGSVRPSGAAARLAGPPSGRMEYR